MGIADSELDVSQQRMNLVMVSIIAGVCCGFYCLLATVILSCFCMRNHVCHYVYGSDTKKRDDYAYSNSNMVIVYPKVVKEHQEYNHPKDQNHENYQASEESTEYTVSETQTSSD